MLQNLKYFDDYIQKAIIKGFNIKDDFILNSITKANEIGRLITMKNKSRILLPDSCCLIGVVDQDGLLDQN